jgi:3-oxoacyl-[acyl-carrier protein] reductase
MKSTQTGSRYCLITGASRGLGRELAEAFWAAGWSLILVARSRDGLAEVAAQLGVREAQSVNTICADLNDIAEVERIVVAAKTMAPRLEMLINNAAIQGPIGPLWENDWALWEATIRINLLAPAALCKATLLWMMQTGGGSIVSVSGGGATSPRPNFSAYATAKAGLVRLSETLAAEAKAHGVRINCVAPGAMSTNMLKEVLAAGASATGRHEHGAAAKVLESGGGAMRSVTDLCLFLASGQAAHISGKLISAIWDDWPSWPQHASELTSSDLYTLRRITARDRGLAWGDK